MVVPALHVYGPWGHAQLSPTDPNQAGGSLPCPPLLTSCAPPPAWLLQAVLVDSKQKDYAPLNQWYQAGDNPQGSHTFDVFPRPPPSSTALPVNTRLKGYYRHPASLFDGTTVIEWTDKSMWIVEPEYRSWEMQHIFFWAKSVFGLWEARVGNSSWGGVLPPIEEVR